MLDNTDLTSQNADNKQRTSTGKRTTLQPAKLNQTPEFGQNTDELSSSSYARPQWYDPPANCRPETIHLVRQLERIDHQLQAMVHNEEYLKDADRYRRHRADALDVYTQLLTDDVRFAHEHQLEAHMWKTMFYTQVEAVKRRLGQQTEANANDEHLQACRASCALIIDDGLAAMERMLHQMEETFDYRLEEFLDVNAGASKRAKGTMRIGLVVSEALLMHLGDLARYREQLGGTRNFGRAKQWYTKAQHLMPTNGKPFNSLAVIAIQTVSLQHILICFLLCIFVIQIEILFPIALVLS